MTAAAVVSALANRGESLASVESLTGGLVAAKLTSVAGSSAVFRGGLVTYATDLKNSLAGVAESITAQGVVTKATVEAMAAGGQLACRADWAIATSGVAGPGITDGVAPGTVWIAVAGPFTTAAREYRFSGNRAEVRTASVAAALALLDEMLSIHPTFKVESLP